MSGGSIDAMERSAETTAPAATLPNNAEREPATAAAQRQNTSALGRTLILSVLMALAIAALAFWPQRPWTPPPRPPLQAPIVFDELVYHPPPPSLPSAAP
jgi:hypothetical protein